MNYCATAREFELSLNKRVSDQSLLNMLRTVRCFEVCKDVNKLLEIFPSIEKKDEVRELWAMLDNMSLADRVMVNIETISQLKII